MRGPRRRLDISLRDAGGNGAQDATTLEADIRAFGVPREASSLLGVQLVVDRRMEVRRDQRVQSSRLVGGEPEPSAVVARDADAERFQSELHVGARFARQA